MLRFFFFLPRQNRIYLGREKVSSSVAGGASKGGKTPGKVRELLFSKQDLFTCQRLHSRAVAVGPGGFRLL